MSDKKVSFESALKNNLIKNFDYTEFENIKPIAGGGFGTVYRANSLNLRKLVALKCLHDVGESLYKKFMKELTNILAVNYHDNIIKFYGISIDPSTETYYLVMQYAKDGDLRTYLQYNFNTLDWKIKIQMAKDITSGLCYIHGKNIVHRDLHSKNILVHERNLLITDLGLSQSLDTNSKSLEGGMLAYSDPGYLRNQSTYKRSKASDIYSLGVLLWEISSGRPPNLEIIKIIIDCERERPINGTPEDYIIIYSNAWKDDPNQRPTIKNIFDSLENIKLENIYNDPNDNQEAYINNQSRASMDVFSKDSVSQPSMDEFGKDSASFSSLFTASNLGKVTDPGYLRNQSTYKRSKASDIYSLGVLLWEISSGRPPNLEIIKIIIDCERERPINGTPEDYIIIYSNAWKDDPNQRPTIKNIFDSLENIKLENIYNDPNDNQEAYINNQSRASMDVFSKDSVSQPSMDEFGKDSASFSSLFTASNLGKVTGISS
ncbi:hypothetical protein Glove_11g46 [Diversispora epigaea]|uniref:Protein kinase domain-containing protein n=1 Tax=Diversispora epigaea TaxID=1348612 RepID=A0A397JQW7_9GLOM|nr:hypothetical protein Glove_11g46 [Diversispora epigaea]